MKNSLKIILNLVIFGINCLNPKFFVNLITLRRTNININSYNTGEDAVESTVIMYNLCHFILSICVADFYGQ